MWDIILSNVVSLNIPEQYLAIRECRKMSNEVHLMTAYYLIFISVLDFWLSNSHYLESSLSSCLLANLRVFSHLQEKLYVYTLSSHDWIHIFVWLLSVSDILWTFQFIGAFIHLFNTYLMSIYYVLGTMTAIGKIPFIFSFNMFGCPIKSESSLHMYMSSIINEWITIMLTLRLFLFFIMACSRLVLGIPSSETLILFEK